MTNRFRTVAVLALSLTAVSATVISCRASASTNVFTESDADFFLQLNKSALALHRDINESTHVLRSHDFEQASCLFELENSLETMMHELNSAFDLIILHLI